MRIFFTLILFCCLYLPSYSQTDAKVEAVYTLAEIPSPLAVYRHPVQARIINTGSTVLSSLPVVLNVTGANLFTDTQRININPHDTLLVDFKTFSPWNTGTNTVTVTVPDDDDLFNNSSAYTQIVNSNTFSYADGNALAGSIGFGTGTGIIANRYTTSGSGKVSQVIVHISDLPSAIGHTVAAVVMDGGSIIGQSDPHIITAGELNTDVVFDIPGEPAILYNFYVGLLQTTDGLTSYLPVAYQNEGVKARPSTYYSALPDGTNLAPTMTNGRFMIKAVVKIGDETPFNFSINQPIDYVLAGWDFSGANSPASFAATTFDTIFASSNLLTRGPGASATPGMHKFRTAGFQNDGIATSNNDYFQVVLTPKPGDALSLSTIGGNLHSNSNTISAPGSGIRSQFAYSFDGVNFTLIGSSFLSTNIMQEFTVPLSGISALQNIPGGTTLTIRFYASGVAASGDWGFFSTRPGYNGLAIYGRLISSADNAILTDPVVPVNADYTLADCSATSTGSIHFTSTGTFAPNNKYIVQLGKIYQPQANIYRFRYPVTVGELATYANEGTINFTIPAATSSYDYALRVVSTGPYTAGSFSQQFIVKSKNCVSQPDDLFRTRASGNWNDLSTWESFHENEWIPATLIPNETAFSVEIRHDHIVTVNSNVSSSGLIVRGRLNVLNDIVNNGTISFKKQGNVSVNPMTIDTAGTFQVASASAIYNDAVLFFDGQIRNAGRIVVGDGGAVAPGFDAFATQSTNIKWLDGSVFEWNASAGADPGCDAEYFPNNFSAITFRLTKIPGTIIGGPFDFTVNGLLEVNTPVTFTGNGTKTFRDGIKGNSILTQAPGSGKFYTTSSYLFIPASATTNAAMQGILGGTVQLNLNNEGLETTGGFTVPDTSKVIVSGKFVSLQTAEITNNAALTILADSLNMDNADLRNDGQLKGPGKVVFTGDMLSTLSSPGSITAPITLSHKQLHLGSNSNAALIKLLGTSNLALDNYNLNMGVADIISDSENFIITNDTGRLIRYTAGLPVLYPVGISNTSYTPVVVTNSGNEDFIKVRVGAGVQSSTPLTSGYVDRTWFVGDTLQTGTSLTLNFQWNAADEQADFDRTNCHISHFSACPANCTVGYFDPFSFGACSGTTSFNIERSGINNFNYPSFVITSKPFVYTFTGNGDWNDAANWSPAIVAPPVIPAGMEVHIDPIVTGECIRNGDILIKTGGTLLVQPGKKMTVTGNLTAE